MKEFLSRLLIFVLLVIYLVIPFKHHFLNSLHFVSHITLQENPYHIHDTSFGDHGHQHTFLGTINHTLNDHGSKHPVPTELTNFKFQTAFPTGFLQTPDINLSEIIISYGLEITADIIDHFYDVPTPPP